MRITNNMILHNSLDGLQTNRAAVQSLQTQISSGTRISAASDDPTASNQLMGTSSALGAIDQYKRNIGTATSRNAVEETALGQVTDLLARARELVTAQATGTATADTRLTASKELESIFTTVVGIGNSKYGDSYLFGGDTASTAPFASTGSGATIGYTTTNPVGSPSMEIASGQRLAPTSDGTRTFLDSKVLSTLRDATKALAANDVAGSLTALSAMDGSFQQVQVLIGENGAKANALDSASQNLDSLKLNLAKRASDLQDVDIEAAVTTLVTKQTAYQAAMSITSKVLGMSLTDYIR
jgi:flagellar hook-associated protein 3 FlgL